MDGKSWTFIQDTAPSHRSNLVQDFLKEKLKSRFIKSTEWLPSSPDCNALDNHFLSKVREMVYSDQFNVPFSNEEEEELKKKIKKVWHEVSYDLQEIRAVLKQFTPRLEAINSSNGKYIKMTFG